MSDLSSTRVHRPSGGSLTGRLIRLSIPTAALGLLAYRFAVTDMGPSGLRPVIAAVFAFLAAFLLVMVLLLTRARTEVGPDDIRNRALGRQVQLPWEDLDDVRVTTRGLMRTAQAVRRDGRVVRLTALRDAPTMPDPGFDDTIEVIRQRIAHHRPADRVGREPGAGR